MSNFESECYVCKGKSDLFNVHNNCKNNVYYNKIIILSHYKNKIISKLIKDLKFYSKKDIAEDF
jgi:predicted amidophosphoribosyltransferase